MQAGGIQRLPRSPPTPDPDVGRGSPLGEGRVCVGSKRREAGEPLRRVPSAHKPARLKRGQEPLHADFHPLHAVVVRSTALRADLKILFDPRAFLRGCDLPPRHENDQGVRAKTVQTPEQWLLEERPPRSGRCPLRRVRSAVRRERSPQRLPTKTTLSLFRAGRLCAGIGQLEGAEMSRAMTHQLASPEKD